MEVGAVPGWKVLVLYCGWRVFFTTLAGRVLTVGIWLWFIILEYNAINRFDNSWNLIWKVGKNYTLNGIDINNGIIIKIITEKGII